MGDAIQNADCVKAVIEGLRAGEPSLGSLTREEQSWLVTAVIYLNRIFEERKDGRPGNQAFCIFDVGKLYVQFLAPWDGEELVCEAASAKTVPIIGEILAKEGSETLRKLGFDPPAISPNYSQLIKIGGADDLGYAARLGFRVLKQVFQVTDFSAATFGENIPESKETTHEIIMKKVSESQKCKVVKSTGKGFVIGGVKPKP
jgi:hypothetical protein